MLFVLPSLIPGIHISAKIKYIVDGPLIPCLFSIALKLKQNVILWKQDKRYTEMVPFMRQVVSIKGIQQAQ
jgi:hypothetical protein